MKRTAILAFVTACNASPHEGPMLILPDAATPDSPPAVNPLTTVDVDVGGATPTLIEYRDGKGQWTIPEMVFSQRYELDVTNDYDLVVVCADGTGAFDAERLLATAGDGPTQSIYCNGAVADVSMATVSGTMNQAGSVWLGNGATSTTAPWTYHLDVPTGMHDLVASDGTRVVLHRALSITAAATEPTIDLATQGTAMTAVPFTIDNAADDDILTTQTYLLTNTDFSQVAFVPGSTAETVPEAMLQANDFQLAITYAANDTYNRWAVIEQPTATDVTLLPRLSGATFDVAADHFRVTFGALPAGDNVDLYANGIGTLAQEQHVSVSSAWLTATGSATIGFDNTIPNYQAPWWLDPTAYGADFSATDQTSGSGTGVESISGPTQTARRSHSLRAIARARHRRT